MFLVLFGTDQNLVVLSEGFITKEWTCKGDGGGRVRALDEASSNQRKQRRKIILKK